MCVVVCSLCSFLEAGKKPACFTSAFHQASTAWEASIRVIVSMKPVLRGVNASRLEWASPLLTKGGNQSQPYIVYPLPGELWVGSFEIRCLLMRYVQSGTSSALLAEKPKELHSPPLVRKHRLGMPAHSSFVPCSILWFRRSVTSGMIV